MVAWTRSGVTPSRWRSALAIAVSLVLTGIAWYAVKTSVELFDSARFDALSKEVRDDISFQMQTYINALVQTRGLYYASKDITREEFRAYVRTVQLLEKYPGIQGIGLTVRIPAAELKQHTVDVRRSGFPNYKVWPDTPRDEYFSILYLEPFDWRNQRAFGFDMYTEPTRHAAMAAARDTGQAVATARLTLVQETNVAQQPGFLIYVPLYRKGAPTDSVEARRAALVGFVYAPFRAHDLFRAVFPPGESDQQPIGFDVYDGAKPSPEALLYSYDGLAAAHTPRFKSELKFNVAGRRWTLIVYSMPEFDLPWTGQLPNAVLTVGVLVTMLVWLMMRATRKELEASRRGDLLLQSMSDGVSVSNEQGYIEYTNPAEDNMFGYEPGELIGKHVSVQNVYAPEENLRIVNDVLRALKEKGEWTGEFENKRKDGTPFTTLARLTAIDLDGKRHFVCVQRDVTELKRAEQAVRESESRFRQVADQAPIMIWMSGLDKGYYYVNKAWLEFSGRTIEQESGFGWTDNVYADDKQQAVNIYSVAFDARKPFSTEYRLRRHDGEYRWVLNHGAPRFTPNGDFVGFIGSCMDITERKQFEQSLQEGIKARDAFLSVVSHELRTPITTLKLQAQIRKKNLETRKTGAFTEDRLARMIDVDNRQIERLHRLVDEMLDISRISTGRFEMHVEMVDLCALVRDIVERLTPQFEAAGCRITVECPEKVVGKWDHFRLEQVLTNLLTNAMKYGAGKPIEIYVEESIGRALLRVRDHGIGIARENQERIFERYERIPAAGQISGLGLGLYIVRKIVQAHGGTIHVDSAIGQGATFIVNLPLDGPPGTPQALS